MFTFIDPGKPGFVHATSSSESVILVEWDQPCPVYGEIVNYDIKYTSINMEDDRHLYEGCLVNRTSDKTQEMDSNITSFNLTDLAYWTSYNICVSAFTTIGQGEENCTIEKTEEYREYVYDNRTLLILITVNGSLIHYLAKTRKPYLHLIR